MSKYLEGKRKRKKRSLIEIGVRIRQKGASIGKRKIIEDKEYVKKQKNVCLILRDCEVTKMSIEFVGKKEKTRINGRNREIKKRLKKNTREKKRERKEKRSKDKYKKGDLNLVSDLISI
jgi:hypothetical protein